MVEELHKFKDIKIEFPDTFQSREEIKENLKIAVSELNLIKSGKSKAMSARELLNEL